MGTLILSLALESFAVPVSEVQESIIVTTPAGSLKGLKTAEYSFFGGIPYGQAPVNGLRFRPPQEHAPWSEVRDATKAGSECVQKEILSGKAKGSEDCLFLNVWTPASATNASKLPVMFWIHGGSFVHGAGSDYQGDHLVSDHDNPVIVVTINYRLGPMGFLASTELAKEDPSFPSLGGANGVLDQRMALQWVRTNIASFGGDPNQVTIFGESAGSLSVCALLSSQMAKGLYNWAMMESGSCVGPWNPLPTNYSLNYSSIFLHDAGADSVAALRNVSATQLLTLTSWNKVTLAVDGVVLPETPRAVFERGESSMGPHSKILLGSNSQDTLWAPPYYNGPFPSNKQQLETNLLAYFPNTTVDAILDVYPVPLAKRQVEQLFVDMSRDVCVKCPTLWMAELAVTTLLNDTDSVFLYEYSYNTDPLVFGAGHAAEIGAVWGRPTFAFSFSRVLSDVVRKYWTSFAAHQNPKASVIWPAFDTETQSYIQLDKIVKASQGYDTERCGFWDSLRKSSVFNYHDMEHFCYQDALKP